MSKGYKVIDLRSGDCFKKSDMYFQSSDAVYETRQMARHALESFLNLNRLIYQETSYKVNRTMNVGSTVEKLIPEYFDIIESSLGEQINVYNDDTGVYG